ncbi:hypothetical protein [Nocardia nepalensis]|uniref:hypothetical protein n=1 Tax=Nocardia nepalensis TaxID=3375448 RepID=UPI003B685646
MHEIPAALRIATTVRRVWLPLEVEGLDEKLLTLGVDLRDREGDQQIRIGGQPSKG